MLAEGVRRAAKFYATGCTIKPPKPVMVATADYRKAEDNLGQFFDSRIKATADENTPKADLRDCETMTGQRLREEYVNWNRENGNTDSTLIGTRNFGERAKARFRYSRPCGVVNYFCELKSGGLGPKVEGEPPPDGYDPM